MKWENEELSVYCVIDSIRAELLEEHFFFFLKANCDHHYHQHQHHRVAIIIRIVNFGISCMFEYKLLSLCYSLISHRITVSRRTSSSRKNKHQQHNKIKSITSHCESWNRSVHTSKNRRQKSWNTRKTAAWRTRYIALTQNFTFASFWFAILCRYLFFIQSSYYISVTKRTEKQKKNRKNLWTIWYDIYIFFFGIVQVYNIF